MSRREAAQTQDKPHSRHRFAGHLAAPATGVTATSVHAAYASFYAGERLIRVLPPGAVPDVRSHGSHAQGVTLGGFSYDASSGRLAMVSVIDNLLKGAATQALQNINIAEGLPEYKGIPGVAPAAA